MGKSLRTEENPEKEESMKKNYEKNQKYYYEKVLQQKLKVKKSCPIPIFILNNFNIWFIIIYLKILFREIIH
jgi:hypothetical protein